MRRGKSSVSPEDFFGTARAIRDSPLENFLTTFVDRSPPGDLGWPGKSSNLCALRENSMHPRRQSAWLRASSYLTVAALLALAPFGKAQGLSSSDLSRFRFAGDAVLSPDGHRLAYTV